MVCEIISEEDTDVQVSIVNIAAVRPSAWFTSPIRLYFTLDFCHRGAHTERLNREKAPENELPPQICAAEVLIVEDSAVLGGVMILALNWITNRFCLQIRTQVFEPAVRTCCAAESLYKLTAEHIAGNNVYLYMSAQCCWVQHWVCKWTWTCWVEPLTSQR